MDFLLIFRRIRTVAMRKHRQERKEGPQSRIKLLKPAFIVRGVVRRSEELLTRAAIRQSCIPDVVACLHALNASPELLRLALTKTALGEFRIESDHCVFDQFTPIGRHAEQFFIAHVLVVRLELLGARHCAEYNTVGSIPCQGSRRALRPKYLRTAPSAAPSWGSFARACALAQDDRV